MKSIQTWLDEYGVSHQNSTNKMIHWICVPLIFFSITGLFYSVKLPFHVAGFRLNLAMFMLAGVTVYYFLLSRTLSIGMLLFALLCFAACHFISMYVPFPLWAVSVIVFVLAWIGQFYGHNVEGKKPSFINDLQFLMIGPAWLMSFIYKKIGIAY